MDQADRNQAILSKYIPVPAVPLISEWILLLNFKLKIKKSRQTKNGDYRPPRKGLNHQITINQNLNKYAFLLTLVHEIAHLITYVNHGWNVKGHGPEWKNCFKKQITPFMRDEVFPVDLQLAIKSYMKNPAASHCNNDDLMRALKSYDAPSNLVFLETLLVGTEFMHSKRHFFKGDKVSKRYKCIEKNTLNTYLFSGLAEVDIV